MSAAPVTVPVQQAAADSPQVSAEAQQLAPVTVAAQQAVADSRQDTRTGRWARPSVRIPTRLRGSPTLWLAAAVLLLALALAVVPGLFTSVDPLQAAPADRLAAPSASHWFGTDELGRDLYSRVVYGARTTIIATVVAVAIGLLIGSVIGLISGFIGGRVDTVLMRLMDVLLAIPGLLLAMAVVTAIGFGTIKVAIAVGVASIASFARVMRAEVLRVRTSPFVEAAFAGGERATTVIFRHVLPNSWGPVAALVALELGSAVLAVSALSFLGYGVVPPAPEWGSLVSTGRAYLATSWWLTTLPGLVVVAVVLAANRVGSALRGADGAGR